ncbi:MAG: ECF transporter S component [Erysipelotrichaceae bacterium]|nr:ECF transporter S component [Erysipelotrichaceae bacterium]MBR6233932.1 ECF transporter S component [Erysipelotrichaceae bacterium]
MKNTRNLILTAMFIAIGVVLPQAFHMIPNAGSVVLPMHIPVLIAGFAVGPLLGAICGFFTPLLSHLIFGMPPAPVLPSMLCELTVYGLMTGLLNKVVKIENGLVKNYVVLIGAMLCGRITYGILNALIFKAGSYSMAAWTSAAFVTALPGIIIQLVLIPILVDRLKKANLF